MMLQTGSVYSDGGKARPVDLKVILSYLVFFVGAVTLYNALSAGFSSILTLSAGLQCLGFVLLAMKVQNQGAVPGLSGKTLIMYAATLCFRLSSTVHLNGYLPVDQTGDWAYQAVEICSLILVGYLMHCVFVSHRTSYQESQDSFPLKIQSAVMGCFILAVAVHPQLWMVSKIGEVE